MAKSVRISDALYGAAQTAAAFQNRSIAQQLEYWAQIGRSSPVVREIEFEAVNRRLHERKLEDTKAIQEGRMANEDIMVFKKEQIKNMEISSSYFDADEFCKEYECYTEEQK
jgi:hypothetical protein